MIETNYSNYTFYFTDSNFIHAISHYQQRVTVLSATLFSGEAISQGLELDLSIFRVNQVDPLSEPTMEELPGIVERIKKQVSHEINGMTIRYVTRQCESLQDLFPGCYRLPAEWRIKPGQYPYYDHLIARCYGEVSNFYGAYKLATKLSRKAALAMLQQTGADRAIELNSLNTFLFLVNGYLVFITYGGKPRIGISDAVTFEIGSGFLMTRFDEVCSEELTAIVAVLQRFHDRWKSRQYSDYLFPSFLQVLKEPRPMADYT